MELLVLPLNRTLRAKPGANLLAVLRQHDIPISHSCLSGRCGTCRCKVLAGQLLQSGQESKMPNVIEDPYVLACQSVLTQDCTIEISEPDEIVVHPARTAKATVASIEQLTHDIRRIRLALSKPLQYSPGQHVKVHFGQDLERPYSMADIRHDSLEFHIRLVADGRVTQHVVNCLAVGDAVKVSGPLGTAYLRRKHSGPMICVAGSTGLAPILSIVRGAIQCGMANPLHVYFGARTNDDVYGIEWLKEAAEQHRNMQIHTVVTTGTADGTRPGLVTDAVASDWSDLAGFRAYIGGPPPMVEAASLVMQQRHLPREMIYADAFYPNGT